MSRISRRFVMKGVGYGFLSGLLIVAMLLQPWPSIARFRALAGDGIRQVDSGLHPNQAAQDASVFLPFVINPLGPPQFDIVNPGGGWTISGTLYFAVQPINPAAFSSVTFKAGSTVLGVDATPEDGFRVFLDAKTLPAGTLELSAIATGPAGETTKSITVNVVPNPPSTGTLGSQGGVLASEIGSIITIPPGAVPDGTNVSVVEKTQEQVTADNGIDWEALGVTFLGAQDIQSTAQFSKPLGVSSAGFGNRVQPGQVVVNYRIMPDANGDGTDEIVVVNAASVAPNNDIVSGPVPQILVRSLNVQLNAKNASLDKLADEISGPPGTLVEIRASGFNPASINGNIAIWTSSVDEQVFELPGLVQPDPASSSDQIFTAVIPPLVPGGATLTLRNESTGATAGPIDVTIATPSPLSKPATEIIDQFWADTIQ
jgi:hypothetical protein